MHLLQNALFLGLTLGLLGKLLISFTVIMVHTKITKEKHIDGLVLMEMHREKYVALFGVALMVLGYILEVYSYGFIQPLV
jgi:hypothetical protein